MRQVRHPLVERDLIGIADHIVETTGGDIDAAMRRLDEIDDLMRAIADNPLSGMRLEPPMHGWLVRHGGRDHRITIVFRPDIDSDTLYVALVGFGGRDWLKAAQARR